MKVALLALAALVFAAPARADIRLFDVPTGASRTVVRDPRTGLRGWSDDGSALLVRPRGGGLVRVALADGSRTPVADADSLGPGGRTLEHTADGLVLHAADGRAVTTLPVSIFDYDPGIAWSRDGARVAVATHDALLILDTAGGTTLLRRAGELDIGPQAFAPDGTALVAAGERRVRRIEVPSGASRVIYTGRAYDFPHAAWGATGRIAITTDRWVGVPGLPALRGAYEDAQWSGDGSLLAFIVAPDPCSEEIRGLAVAAPGGPVRKLVAPQPREVAALWSPVGATLAIDQGPKRNEKRGRRHPWPNSVPHEYAMFSKRGNAAMRRIVLRAARKLRHGAGREETLARVRTDYAKADARFDEAGDTAVREAVADELDRWLHAAGFARIEAYDEITC